MFGNGRRVEEDLERIRRANLPPEQMEAEEKAERRARENAKDVTGKDIFAMILAAFSIVLPYVAVFVGLLLAFWLFIKLL